MAGLLLPIWLGASASRGKTPAEKGGGALCQLRIYEIFEHNKAAFPARFRDHALRIMKRNGFDIVATWEATTAARTEFVYVSRWPNEDLLKSQWTSFMADEEWARIKRETAAVNGALVGAIEERLLRATDYSPGQWR